MLSRVSLWIFHTQLTSDMGKEKGLLAEALWAMPDSNQRPLPCRGSALNQLS